MGWDAEEPLSGTMPLIRHDRDMPMEEPTVEAQTLVAETHNRFPNLDGPRVQRRILDDRGVDVPVGQVNACLAEIAGGAS